MCGIAGFWDPKAERGGMGGRLEDMVRRMRHRGPDASGVWVDERDEVGFGHARLSILDLSELGAQPMHSACGRYVICYNGEVYNFASLRDLLAAEGFSFRGGSDTEVILAAVAHWGVEAAVKRFVGMFAFALWDRAERELVLCRDRLGIKPLYVGLQRGTLVFASELKPFHAIPEFELAINRNSLAVYFRHNYIPAPHSIFENVFKLRPGHLMRFRRGDLDRPALPQALPFWSAKEVVSSRGGGWFEGSEEEAVEALDKLLREAVGMRMIADVPLGAFLSGGIDSSTVAALMQVQSSKPIKTFCIGNVNEGFNEARHAAEVAKHLGTDHTELYVTESEAQEVIPELPRLYDEPFSDSSQIPTYLVSRLARKDVVVSLSGDGGDELFCGYNRYDTGLSVWRKLQAMPGFARRAAGWMLTCRPPEWWDRAYRLAAPIIPARYQVRLPGNKAHKLAETLKAGSVEGMYRTLVSHWSHPGGDLVIGGREPLTNLTDESQFLADDEASFAEKMMYFDLVSYLPDDILTKVDRASMGVGLEARVPLIDHRVVEFAWSLPHSLKTKGATQKWILRRVLERYVPAKLFERPKMGFGVPIEDWIRGDLRDWCEDLLDADRIREEGWLRPEPIQALWKQHKEGAADWHYLLWDVLMFQSWLRDYRRN